MGRARIDEPPVWPSASVAGLAVLDRVLDPGERADAVSPVQRLVLPFELRSRSRLRARLESGVEVAVVLPRGTVVRGGSWLAGGDLVVEVVAAPEDVIVVRATSPRALLQAAYHLGNRHVPVQVDGDGLVLGYDPVLVDMLVRMGATLRRTLAPFEPEAGAYGAAHGH